jgi:hypothetical protein
MRLPATLKPEGDVTMECSKMSRLGVVLILFVILVSPMGAAAETVQTDLTGYEETPLTLSTPASAEFKA